jgi:hypothetical protein
MSPINKSGMLKILALVLALLMISTVLVTLVFALLNDL